MSTTINREVLSTRRLFLREFIMNVLISYNSLHPENKTENKELKFKEETEKAPLNLTNQKRKEIEINLPQKQITPVMITQPTKAQNTIAKQRNQMQKRILPSTYMTQIQQEKPQIINLPGISDQPDQHMSPLTGSLGRITPLLTDPSVQSVECPGPNKPVLVNKTGIMQTTKIILNKEEIDYILQSVSKTTRIPLMAGTFKAAFGIYIITAVLSEFVGSRFIIQKRNPFSKY